MGRHNSSACYRELGAVMRSVRKAAGLSGSDIAHRTGWSQPKISRVELGCVDVSVTDVIHYVILCGLKLPQAQDIIELARRAERKAGYWLSDKRVGNTLGSLIYHESAADRSTCYEPQVVPGLLQTRDYAHVQIAEEPGATPAEVDAAVRTRMERQQILRWRRPARFVFYVHEQALRLPVGNPRVMHEQLLHLVLLTAQPHLTLRVVPTVAGARSAFGGSFQLFEYAKYRPLVYLDHLGGGGLFLEDKRYVADYQRLLPELREVALDEAESRVFAAALADEHDRGSQPDAAQHVEEEQLQ